MTLILQKHDFFSTDQSAFLKHNSTITSLHKVNEDWLESIENAEISLVCYFDLKNVLTLSAIKLCCSNLKNTALIIIPLPGSNLTFRNVIFQHFVITPYQIFRLLT